MQRARDPESQGADPVRVFVTLAAVLVAIGAFFLFTRTDPTSDSEASPTSATPDFSLTDEEAITRFKELDQLRIAVLRNRDASLLSQVFVPGSPAEKRVSRTLSVLRQENTIYRSRSENDSLLVVLNAPSKIKVKQVVFVEPRFINEAGDDVTTGRDELQTIVWEMGRFNDEWFLYDGLLTDVEKA